MSFEDVGGTEGHCRGNDCIRVQYKPATKKVFVMHFFLPLQSLYLAVPDFVDPLAIVLVFCGLSPIVSGFIRPATCLLRIEQSYISQTVQFFKTLSDHINTLDLAQRLFSTTRGVKDCLLTTVSFLCCWQGDAALPSLLLAETTTKSTYHDDKEDLSREMITSLSGVNNMYFAFVLAIPLCFSNYNPRICGLFNFELTLQSLIQSQLHSHSQKAATRCVVETFSILENAATRRTSSQPNTAPTTLPSKVNVSVHLRFAIRQSSTHQPFV